MAMSSTFKVDDLGPGPPPDQSENGKDLSPNKEKESSEETHLDYLSSRPGSVNVKLSVLEDELFARSKDLELLQKEIMSMKSQPQDSLPIHEDFSPREIEENLGSEVQRLRKDKHLMSDLLKQAHQELVKRDSSIQQLKREIMKLRKNISDLKNKVDHPVNNFDTQNVEISKVENRKPHKFTKEYMDFQGRLDLKKKSLRQIEEKNKVLENLFEENEVLKDCLNKIYTKLKTFCFPYTQVCDENIQEQHQTSNLGNEFDVETIKKCFEQFCEANYKLQEELTKLRHSRLTTETGEMEHVFYSPDNDYSFNELKEKRGNFKDDSKDMKLKHTKGAVMKNYGVNEKFVKVVKPNYMAVPFSMKQNASVDSSDAEYKCRFLQNENNKLKNDLLHTQKQLEMLHSQIFEAVHLVHDVEVEGNSDEILVEIVTSIAEECSALRQEVSYLRKLRQEQKQSWNKLQHFMMNAEKKLEKDGRSTSSLREVIKNLGQLIASSHSSSLDETILYLYSNQLEWLEKLQIGYDSSCGHKHRNFQESGRETLQTNELIQEYNNLTYSRYKTASTQTKCIQQLGENDPVLIAENNMRDISVQADHVLPLVNEESKINNIFPSSRREINREIYVVHEVQEELEIPEMPSIDKTTMTVGEQIEKSNIDNITSNNLFSDTISDEQSTIVVEKKFSETKFHATAECNNTSSLDKDGAVEVTNIVKYDTNCKSDCVLERNDILEDSVTKTVSSLQHSALNNDKENKMHILEVQEKYANSDINVSHKEDKSGSSHILNEINLEPYFTTTSNRSKSNSDETTSSANSMLKSNEILFPDEHFKELNNMSTVLSGSYSVVQPTAKRDDINTNNVDFPHQSTSAIHSKPNQNVSFNSSCSEERNHQDSVIKITDSEPLVSIGEEDKSFDNLSSKTVDSHCAEESDIHTEEKKSGNDLFETNKHEFKYILFEVHSKHNWGLLSKESLIKSDHVVQFDDSLVFKSSISNKKICLPCTISLQNVPQNSQEFDDTLPKHINDSCTKDEKNAQTANLSACAISDKSMSESDAGFSETLDSAVGTVSSNQSSFSAAELQQCIDNCSEDLDSELIKSLLPLLLTSSQSNFEPKHIIIYQRINIDDRLEQYFKKYCEKHPEVIDKEVSETVTTDTQSSSSVCPEVNQEGTLIPIDNKEAVVKDKDHFSEQAEPAQREIRSCPFTYKNSDSKNFTNDSSKIMMQKCSEFNTSTLNDIDNSGDDSIESKKHFGLNHLFFQMYSQNKEHMQNMLTSKKLVLIPVDLMKSPVFHVDSEQGEDNKNESVSTDAFSDETIVKTHIEPNFGVPSDQQDTPEASLSEPTETTSNFVISDHGALISERIEIGIQTEALIEKIDATIQTDDEQELMQAKMKELETTLGEMQDVEKQHMQVACDMAERIEIFKQTENALKKKLDLSEERRIAEVESVRQEWSVRENSYQDEISALKENLEQQNAVLQRLKEENDKTNLILEEKEQTSVLQQNQIMSLEEELKKLETKLNYKVDAHDFYVQTDVFEDVNYQTLNDDITNLREENKQCLQKIAHQGDVIQHIKSQLHATISHLQVLKDAAARQLQKQKRQLLRVIQEKQQLHEAEILLGCQREEIEKQSSLLQTQREEIEEMQNKVKILEEELGAKLEILHEYERNIHQQGAKEKINSSCQTEVEDEGCYSEEECLKKTHIIALEKQSEQLLELQTKLSQLESIYSNAGDPVKNFEGLLQLQKMMTSSKFHSTLVEEAEVWKLLKLSEQTYVNLVEKLTESLKLNDLRGGKSLMNSSWLESDDVADARRQDHRKILESLEQLKTDARNSHEIVNQEKMRQVQENTYLAERRPANTMCHSDDSHFQYLSEILRRAQESLAREQLLKVPAQQRIVADAGSGRSYKRSGSKERRIPLELKNGKILALLDDKVNQKELLPNKHDYSKMEPKTVNSAKKSKTFVKL